MSEHGDRLRSWSQRQYNANQLRLDTWNDLQVSAKWLEEISRQGRGIDEPSGHVAADLETLAVLERYFAFPGSDTVAEIAAAFAAREYDDVARRVRQIVRLLVGDAYRENAAHRLSGEERDREHGRSDDDHRGDPGGLYFETLFVDAIDEADRADLRERLQEIRRPEDEFVYDIVVVPSFEDAIIAILFNRTIQSCVLRYDFAYPTANRHPVFDRYLDFLAMNEPKEVYGLARSVELGRIIKRLRPEIDLFLVTDTPLDQLAGNLGTDFRRAFYRVEQLMELHLSILKGIRARYETPFFDALRRFSQKPTGVFHALPIARAKSMMNSFWARDLARFYGANIFLAETSATSGGLDSLLQPTGPIKRAQALAARAFNANHSFFVTNGTSTANKIVVQALVSPGDIVLVSRDCHKSHHYALMLAGAFPVYLDAYPLSEYSMYGGVPLIEIKRSLLELRREGKLDRVRMLLLTNCTFDGITYDPERIMSELLAIKPDLIFVWDEAWFAFATFSSTLRRRTAMTSADDLHEMYRSEAYRARYEPWKEVFDELDPDDDATWLDRPLMADPDRVRVRVYATHSTHKTLTALRQGSMIHVRDEDFAQMVSDAFHEAFMTHTSTSPNYQIIASLDVGRRQVELEGYELVHRSIGLAMILRERIAEHALIRRYFRVLRPCDMIPADHRTSGLESYYEPEKGWHRMEEAWRTDEFALDPTRVTVHIGRTGMDGDRFRHLLMDEYDIQINKTSRNSVLFMTNIGTTRGDVAYLVEVLAQIARSIDERLENESAEGRRMHERRVRALTEEQPPLPNFSAFHETFRPDARAREGDLRRAYFLAYQDTRCEYLRLDGSVRAAIDSGREVISASFVTPYPPGFPVLVPGQVVSGEILDYLRAVDVKEIHGYKPEYGLRIFREDALAEVSAPAAAAITS